PFADGTTAAYRLESTTYPGLASGNGHYTKQEFKELQLMAMDYGINVVPEIDTPGHSRAFTSYNPALGDERGLDISKPETVEFVKSLFNEYLDGSDPTFVGPEVHIGTDEYWGPDIERFRWYMDTLV
ncbi:family 20 glycosylhydrolase, partial [Clostridium perfringens]